MLSWNKVFLSACKQKESYYINQAFKTAGEEFKVFDNCTYDIIVPYGKRGNEIIEALCSEKVKWNPKLMDALIKEAGQYSISVFDYQLKKLNDEGAIEANNDLSRPFIMLKEGFYDDYGLMSDNKNSDKKYII
jgi:CRISPR-associated endonuclease/helicase Cas3